LFESVETITRNTARIRLSVAGYVQGQERLSPLLRPVYDKVLRVQGYGSIEMAAIDAYDAMVEEQLPPNSDLTLHSEQPATNSLG
jgi:hypothetical protein